MPRDAVLDRAFSQRRAVTRVAHAAGISTAAVSQWRRVPKRHLAIVSAVTGIPQEELRPDICPAPSTAEAA
jgi:DNA-binding transcriptional regulator YdaS (Cro superfamily)